MHVQTRLRAHAHLAVAFQSPKCSCLQLQPHYSSTASCTTPEANHHFELEFKTHRRIELATALREFEQCGFIL